MFLSLVNNIFFLIIFRNNSKTPFLIWYYYYCAFPFVIPFFQFSNSNILLAVDFQKQRTTTVWMMLIASSVVLYILRFSIFCREKMLRFCFQGFFSNLTKTQIFIFFPFVSNSEPEEREFFWSWNLPRFAKVFFSKAQNTKMKLWSKSTIPLCYPLLRRRQPWPVILLCLWRYNYYSASKPPRVPKLWGMLYSPPFFFKGSCTKTCLIRLPCIRGFSRCS